MARRRTLIRAGRAVDASTSLGPAVILLDGGDIVAAELPTTIGDVPDADVVELPDSVVMPAFVNAHCHLDLSNLDPQPYDGDFAAWLDGIRTGRPTADDDVAVAVRRGIHLSRLGGTGIVGDIDGRASGIPARELRADGLAGVSYLELIGVGPSRERAMATLQDAAGWPDRETGCVRMGISPHAPYTCDTEIYRSAAALPAPMATHLAETPDETESIDELAEVLAMRPVAAAHVNYVTDQQVRLLAETRTTVVFCPRAAAFFGHRSHGYRRMIQAGVNVALGTDGLPCLDRADRLSVLDDMRLLYRRDDADPVVLLRMATTAGAVGLGLDPDFVTLAPGPVAGLIALGYDSADPVDALEQVLQRDDAPEWVIR
jgi:cytosine/adenosine deaminase-related metal-dependent hydrolase